VNRTRESAGVSSTRVERLRARAAREVAGGRFWRAKELLRAAVSQSDYDPDLYEQFGTVLLAMGDNLEAGRWLFLSGRRDAEYGPAVALFLERHGRRGGARLCASFPAGARLGGPSHYPPPLCDELRELGVPEDAPPGAAPQDVGENRVVGLLARVGCTGCFAYLGVSVVVGAVVVGRWVVDRVAALLG
jgi:hypothetical protein